VAGAAADGAVPADEGGAEDGGAAVVAPAACLEPKMADMMFLLATGCRSISPITAGFFFCSLLLGDCEKDTMLARNCCERGDRNTQVKALSHLLIIAAPIDPHTLAQRAGVKRHFADAYRSSPG
jgi:hypothetical protein